MPGVVLPTSVSLFATYNVRSYGAKGDGTTDDTAAIQSALNAAGTGGPGATCYAPPGNYVIAGQLNVPTNVQFVGSFEVPPTFTSISGSGYPAPGSGGTCLSITGNAGNANATAAVTLNWNSTLRGFLLYWPNQVAGATNPTAYPWAILFANAAQGGAALDCCLLNPYQGILIDNHPRADVRRVVGQPISVGLSVTSTTDIVRLRDVHWVPIWWATFTWQQAHGIGFLFGRTDEQLCDGLFALGYNAGYSFYNQTTGTNTGQCYGEFTGCGADACNTAVLCADSATNGIRFAGCGFAGVGSGGSSFLSQSGGLLQFGTCSFWLPSNSFTQTGGNLMLNGCAFRDATTIALSGTATSMIGNLFGSASATIALSGTGKATLVGNTAIGASFTSLVSGTATGGTVSANNN